MKIIDEIKRIVEDVQKIPFIYSSLVNINALLDDCDLPCVACLRFANGSFINEGGLRKEKADFLIFFIDETEFDFDSLENQKIIDSMADNALAFIREVEKSSDILYTNTELGFEAVYDKFDYNVTGVALRISLKSRSGVVDCYPVPEEEVPKEPVVE